MELQNWSMKWVVAKFTDTEDYNVLPINWLVENETEKLATSTIKTFFYNIIAEKIEQKNRILSNKIYQ